MLNAEYDITAIGLPFIDIIANVDDDFIKSFGLEKHQARDYQPAHILAIRSELKDYAIYPGGSSANTCAGINALGGKAVYLGRVCDDTTGRTFRNAFPPGNVLFPNKPYGNDPRLTSGIVIVLMTPDGATTIAANPGVGDTLTDADIFPDLIKNSELFFTQGHFLLVDTAKDAVDKAIAIAKSAKREIIFSLHGQRFNAERAKIFREDHLPKADIVIGNRNEFELLFRPFDMDGAIKGSQLMVVTDGGRGAYIVGRGEKLHIPPYVLKARDNTVGAGDAFAAGFFFGYGRGLTLQSCSDLGAEAASAVLDVPGARPVGSWQAMADKYLAAGPASLRTVPAGNPV